MQDPATVFSLVRKPMTGALTETPPHEEAGQTQENRQGDSTGAKAACLQRKGFLQSSGDILPDVLFPHSPREWADPHTDRAAYPRHKGCGREVVSLSSMRKGGLMEVRQPKKRGPKPKKCRGRFFYIEKNQWSQVCSYKVADMQSAYAIMARGANGENHKTTEWSVNSVEKRLKIPEWKAKAEIERLVNEGFLKRAGFVGEDTRRPIYEIVLPEKPEWICVPNSIVEGLNKGSKPSPLLQLKLVGNVLALRILIDLYSFLKLESVGGCSILSRLFHAEQICEWNAWKVWSFTDTSRQAAEESLAFLLSCTELALMGCAQQITPRPHGRALYAMPP